MTAEEYAAWGLLKLLQAAVLARMAYSALLTRYRAFASYLALALASSIILLIVGQNSYIAMWSWVTVILLIPLSLSVAEVHYEIQKHCPPVPLRHVLTALLVAPSSAPRIRRPAYAPCALGRRA